ncbi:MAG: hypothetical protein MR425_06105 [Lachnospiraceae bacterium]|nr:hypothetical protein [Lachnospiraceae bacterium]
MSDLLELKEKMRHFYGKYEVYLLPVVRFVLAFATFYLISSRLGYMEKISSLPVTLVIALLCSILPVNAIILFAAVLVLVNLYALSLEVCVTGLLLFLIIGLLYFRFAPKDGYYTLLTPICFTLHIPYAVPVSAGLLKEPATVMSVISGTVVYYFLAGVEENATLLGQVDEEGKSATSKFVIALNQLLGNKEMYLVLATFILMMILVYAIRRMSVDHAWTIAIITGILVGFVMLLAGFLLLGITGRVTWLVIGSVISMVIGLVEQFLFFDLDYSRTERVQFEDDEYYYYVKAVPKMYVPTTDKQVKNFSKRDEDFRKKERITKEDLAKDMDIDRDLLDL